MTTTWATIALALFGFLHFGLVYPRGQDAASTAQSSTAGHSPVIVELFTSEGCSSCPPADALLRKLSQQGSVNGVPVITLGEHVDYWNSLGWRDRFSSAQFTERQEDYVRRFHLATAYTPQMVINGREQTVGNNENAVYRGILQSARSGETAGLKLIWDAPAKLRIEAQDQSGKKVHVWLVIREDGLTTSIKGGENRGRTLQHASVVRRLLDLGAIKDQRFVKVADIKVEGDWNVAHLSAVAFVQAQDEGAILDAAEIPFPANR